MHSFSHLSVRQRLIWLILLASGLAFLCVTVMAVFFEASTFRPRAVEQLSTEAGVLEEVLSAPLDFGLQAAAQKSLKNHYMERPIVLAALYDTNALFAAYQRAGATVPPPTKPGAPGHKFTVRRLSLWWPIHDNEEKLIGHLYLLADLPPWHTRLAQYAIMTIAVLMALAVVGFVLMHGLRRNILRPLAALVDTTTQVARHNDYAIRAVVQQEDELGQLARAFNQMLDAVGQRDAALLEASIRIEHVFNSATEIAIISTDPQGFVTVFNTGAERMLGYSARETVGQLSPVSWHKADEIETRAAELARQLGRPIAGFETFVALARRSEPEAREWTFIRKDGTQFTGYLVVTAVRDATGGIAGFLGVITDITQRKLADEKVRESERNYREVFNSASDAIFIHEIPGGRLADVNDAMLKMYGFADRAEALAAAPDDLRADEPPYTQVEVQEHLRRTMEEGPQTFEWHARKCDGSLFWTEVALRQSSIGGQIRILASVRDITERKRTEEEKEKLQTQLLHAQKMESVGRLAGGVAHDFNNMLMGVMNYAELCRDKIAPDHPIREWLDEIIADAERSAKLTQQLLAFARKQIIAPKVLDVNEVIEGMLKLLRRLIGEDIAIKWLPGPGTLPVKMDPAQIDQILANLAVNARDAIGGVGSIVIETSNTTFDESYCADHPECLPGRFVLLSVSDTGCGMQKDVLDHIFEPFFTTKGVGEGTGLGLATVYGIVKQNNGFINVYSEPGKGTTFKICLPGFVSTEAAQVAVARSPKPPRGTATVLLVEDDKSVRVTTCLFLQDLGYTVLVSGDPEEALSLAAQHPGEIHLLITDVIMPGMSGRDLANRLSELRPALKRLFISGFTADVIAQRGILDDGVDFLSKPFDRDQLARKVREVLEKN